MKIFIDLGAFTGDTIVTALKKYRNLDKIYAFEPLSKNFEKLKELFGNNKNIFLINAAADIVDDEKKLYLGKDYGDLGGSLVDGKTTCFKDKFEKVKTVDFSKYILETFNPTDRIILKIDIEGKEYEVLTKMIKDGSIKYINEIYAEWHFSKIGMDLKTHQKHIKQLRKYGFNLTGEKHLDDFRKVKKISKIKLQFRKYWFYYAYQCKIYLKIKFS